MRRTPGMTALDQFATYLRSAYPPELVSVRAERGDVRSLTGCLDTAAAAVVVGDPDLEGLRVRPAFAGCACSATQGEIPCWFDNSELGDVQKFVCQLAADDVQRID
jgi:hypothetical protein